MYLIENIIRSATRNTSKDKLSIFIINNMYDDYIHLICKTGHDFYILPDPNVPQWGSNQKPINLTIYNSLAEVKNRYFDFILIFDKYLSYHKAIQFSHMYHLPILYINIGGSEDGKKPFFTMINGNKGTGGILASLFHYKLPGQTFTKTINQQKILLDGMLHPQYIESLPLNTSMITFNKTEAAAYLHLWECITPLMLDCMASNIPVITLRHIDFTELEDKKLCLFINNLNEVPNVNINKFNTQNAYEYAVQESMEGFVKNINNFFNNAIDSKLSFYNRG